jgi:hypothetical protein
LVILVYIVLYKMYGTRTLRILHVRNSRNDWFDPYMRGAATDAMAPAEEYECLASYLRLPRLSTLMSQSEGGIPTWPHRVRAWLLRWEAHAGEFPLP